MRVPGGLHHVEILSTPAKQLVLKVILCSFGSEYLAQKTISKSCTGVEWHNNYQSSLDGLRRPMEGFTFLRKEFSNSLKGSVFVN